MDYFNVCRHLERKKEDFRMQSFFSVATSVCQCDIHLLEAVLHKQTTPKATAGWLNNHRLFSLFSTIAHWKFLVGPPHAPAHLLNTQLTRPVKFTPRSIPGARRSFLAFNYSDLETGRGTGGKERRLPLLLIEMFCCLSTLRHFYPAITRR